MVRHPHDVLTAVTLQKLMPPFLTILSNVIPQDRDGPKRTTTWWTLPSSPEESTVGPTVLSCNLF